MRKIPKRTIIMLVVAFICLVTFDLSASASEKYNSITVEDVEKSFAKDEQTLQDFNNLSVDKKEEFVEALNNPDIFNEKVEITIEKEEMIEIPDSKKCQ